MLVGEPFNLCIPLAQQFCYNARVVGNVDVSFFIINTKYIHLAMASRSPTLRASVADPHEKDVEKSGLDGPHGSLDGQDPEKRDSVKRPRKASQNVDPFGDAEEGDVQYRSLEWWQVRASTKHTE